MSDTIPVYQSLISARSRRLRTIALLLLAVVIGMAAYGYLSLMPALRVAAARVEQANTRSTPTPTPNGTLATPAQKSTQDTVARMSRKERDAQAAKLVFAYAFWGVCLTLLLAVMLVAWLDFREVGRNFDQQQAAIFAASLKNETANTE